MPAEVPARRQQREHRAVDVGDALHERDGLRAQRLRGRQRLVVPLDVEALPAAAEERVEAEVGVSGRGADVALVEELQRLVADRLPVVVSARIPESGSTSTNGLTGTAENMYISALYGAEERRVVGELPVELVPHLPAQVHVHHRREEHVQDDELRREPVDGWRGRCEHGCYFSAAPGAGRPRRGASSAGAPSTIARDGAGSAAPAPR